MPKLLYVEASPRKDHSASQEGAGVFLSMLAKQRPDIVVDKLDLWLAGLPEFDGDVIAAKYAKLAGREMSEREGAAWKQIGKMVDRVKEADAILIATPMWNFGIPYKLKHWIDLITQPGFTFSFDPATGYSPLLDPRPTLVILSSAGDYRTGISRGRPDLATSYLREACKFVGLTDVTFVPIGPTVGPADQVSAAKNTAHAQLAKIASSFGRLAA